MTDSSRRAETLHYWTSAVDATGARRADDPRASDTRSTSEIIATHLRSRDNSDAGDSRATVHYAVAPRNFGRHSPCSPVLTHVSDQPAPMSLRSSGGWTGRSSKSRLTHYYVHCVTPMTW